MLQSNILKFEYCVVNTIVSHIKLTGEKWICEEPIGGWHRIENERKGVLDIIY